MFPKERSYRPTERKRKEEKEKVHRMLSGVNKPRTASTVLYSAGLNISYTDTGSLKPEKLIGFTKHASFSENKRQMARKHASRNIIDKYMSVTQGGGKGIALAIKNR